MISNKRRIILIVASVSLGSVFAALLLRSRNGAKELGPNEWMNLAINFGFALAIVIVIAFFLARTKKP